MSDISFVTEIIGEGFANTDSSDALKKQFDKFCDWCWGHGYGDCDVDKVVEQFKKLKMRYFLTIANTGDADKDCAYKNIANTIDRAIDIVKGGGAE